MRRIHYKALITDVNLVKVCFYCGDYADALDHILPWSQFRRPYCVPSCRECNSTLGAKIHDTLGDRAEYICAKYLRKYKRALKRDHVELLKGCENWELELLKIEQALAERTRRRIRHLLVWMENARSVGLSELEPHSQAMADTLKAFSALHS